MDNEIVKFFNQHYALYKVNNKLTEEEAIEFTFFDLKKQFGENIDLRTLYSIPKLYNYLVQNPKGEKSYFHFGKPNSQLSQICAAISQKYI